MERGSHYSGLRRNGTAGPKVPLGIANESFFEHKVARCADLGHNRSCVKACERPIVLAHVAFISAVGEKSRPLAWFKTQL